MLIAHIMVKRTSELGGEKVNTGRFNTGITNDQTETTDSGSCGVDTPEAKRLKNCAQTCGYTSGKFISHETEFPHAITPACSQSSEASTAVSTVLSTIPVSCPKTIASLLRNEANYCLEASKFVAKRLNYISWDDYFMAVATLSAYRSKDPYHPTGACIVDPSNRIIGTGYNGFPSGSAGASGNGYVYVELFER